MVSLNPAVSKQRVLLRMVRKPHIANFGRACLVYFSKIISSITDVFQEILSSITNVLILYCALCSVSLYFVTY